MTAKRDFLSPAVMVLMLVTSLAGVLSVDFSKAYDIVNRYGHTVTIYGNGIYAQDSFFRAPLFIGTDYCILLAAVPLFLYSYIQNQRKHSAVTELKLTSMYGVSLYYAASIAFGVTYNVLFLVYTALFSCSLFGLFIHGGNAVTLCGKAVPISRGLKLFLTLTGAALFVAWLPDVVPTIYQGTTLPLIEVYTTEITYVLDMGILSPITIICWYLLAHNNPVGTVILGTFLKLGMIVGVMMVAQTISQLVSGIALPLPMVVTKSASFAVLGIFAAYFNRKMYQQLVQS